MTPRRCPVCGDPTGVRCCEYGADRERRTRRPFDRAAVGIVAIGLAAQLPALLIAVAR